MSNIPSFLFSDDDQKKLDDLSKLGITSDNSTIGIAIINEEKVPGLFVFDKCTSQLQLKYFLKMYPVKCNGVIDYYFADDPLTVDDIDSICEPFSWPDWAAITNELLKQIDTK